MDREDQTPLASPTTNAANAEVIAREIAWSREVLELRKELQSGQEEAAGDPLETLAPPLLPAAGSHYADIVHRFGLGAAERLVLVLSFLPHIKPDVLDPFFIRNAPGAPRP